MMANECWTSKLKEGYENFRGLNITDKECDEILSLIKEKDAIIKEKDKEIVELKVENAGFDKAVSSFFMWLSAKIHENFLIDPTEARDELQERLKESKIEEMDDKTSKE
jgi:hypothetical protein